MNGWAVPARVDRILGCPYCPRRFNRVFSVSYHVRLTHTDRLEEYRAARRGTCGVCGEVLRRGKRAHRVCMAWRPASIALWRRTRLTRGRPNGAKGKAHQAKVAEEHRRRESPPASSFQDFPLGVSK